jgi:lipoate-protein ligase A
MKWYFINTFENSGKFNMDFDLCLADYIKEDEAVLRLYRWRPYCISLGANQKTDSINIEKAKRDNIEIVTRPTGGRAILHAEEMTYSVIFPINENTSAKNVYKEINMALLEGLKIYNDKLGNLELETVQPDFPSLYKEEASVVCFTSSAKSEIKYEGKKIVGSAQRKLENSILQHGSILCGSFHKNIVNYLNLSEETYSSLSEDLNSNTTDIRAIINETVNYNNLAKAISEGFEKHFNFNFVEDKQHELLGTSI